MAFSVADRAYFSDFRYGATHGLTISRPHISRLTGRPIVVFARAFRDGTGQFAGIKQLFKGQQLIEQLSTHLLFVIVSLRERPGGAGPQYAAEK